MNRIDLQTFRITNLHYIPAHVVLHDLVPPLVLVQVTSELEAAQVLTLEHFLQTSAHDPDKLRSNSTSEAFIFEC